MNYINNRKAKEIPVHTYTYAMINCGKPQHVSITPLNLRQLLTKKRKKKNVACCGFTIISFICVYILIHTHYTVKKNPGQNEAFSLCQLRLTQLQLLYAW